MNQDGQDQQDVLPKGWCWATLGEVAFLNPRSFETSPEEDEIVSFVPMACVEAETGRLDPSQGRPWKEVKKGYTLFHEGDVLFAKITPCMENGKAALATGLQGRRGAGSTEFHVLRPSEAVYGKLLLLFLLQESFRRAARTKMKGTAGQLRVPQDFLESAVLPLPPLPEQHRIVAEIEKQFTRLDAGVAALKRVQANLKRYRASVLKAACEGRLVLRVGQTSRSALSSTSRPEVCSTVEADETSAPLFVPFNPEAGTRKTARRLPHWQQERCTYFITFRLADSIPQDKLRAWQRERDYWLQRNPLPWTLKQQHEYSERFGERLERYLDAGYGSCVLRRPEYARIVEGSLRFYDGQHYDLADFVVMPNHVHLLVRPRPGHSLSKILQAWKGYTSKEINRLAGRTGTRWLDESFDHIVRSRAQLMHYRRYIHENPVKAGLREEEFILGCGQWKIVEQTSGLLEQVADETSAPQLLERILKERRPKWEADELAKMKAKGKPSTDDKWKAKYKEPAAPDVSNLPPLPEGWVWATLEQLSWDASYGTSEKCDYKYPGPPVLRIPNIEKGRVELDDLKFASDATKLDAAGALKPGDFLVIRTNGSRNLIGRGALIRDPFTQPHFFASYLIRFRIIEPRDIGNWLAAVWEEPNTRVWIESVAATSAGQYNVSLSTLNKSVIPLPPLAEQQRIVAEVERRLSVIDEMEAVVETNLKRAERLRQAILKRAFEGKLVPQDPTDEPAEKLLERIRAERARQQPNTKTRSSRKTT